ncbi:MAG: DegV family protein [Clostridiales bacterium]|nr:DegV family protein [Clostridiales bacterium]
MKKFVIVTDSCSELDKELRQKYDVDYIPMHIRYGEREDIADLDWGNITINEFYDLLRQGVRMTTAQITVNEYKERFKSYLDAGFDVLSISCSSGLSASVKASFMARDELLNEYKDSKIICIDSLNACFGLGLLCLTASDMRAEGKTIEEVAEFIELNKKRVNQECTVESLTYLKRAGRVSATSAFFGGILSVKPIIVSDLKGINHAVEKVKGRAKSFERLIERFNEEYEDVPHQKIYIVHADCLDGALTLKEMIEKTVKDKEICIGNIGPIVGSTTGPGTVAIYFYGKPVTVE